MIETKSIVASNAKVNASNKADNSSVLLQCVFGENSFKDEIFNQFYWRKCYITL